MEKPTNNHLDYLKFVTFLAEGLPFVDAWTPTKINHGGCGLFAEILTDELDKLNISYKIWGVYFSKRDQAESKPAILNFLKTGNLEKKAGVGHVLIQIDSLFVDCTGIVNADACHALSKVELSKKQLTELNADLDAWNDTFDRDCLPGIKQAMDKLFSDYANFKAGSLKFPGEKEVRFTPHTIHYLQMMSNPFMSAMNHINNSSNENS